MRRAVALLTAAVMAFGAQPAAQPAAQAATPGHPVPPVSAPAKAAGLVDIRSVVPDAIVDLRYATPHNFTHTRLYPTYARCLVHQSFVRGLQIAAKRLRQQGLVLVFWDCYRPHPVQVRMFQIVPDPAWVARPGNYARSHEAARSVDVTVARASTKAHCTTGSKTGGHCRLDMGTGFDDFTSKAHAYATSGLTHLQVEHRAILRKAMAVGGITVYSGEWWHFDGPGASTPRPILHVRLS